MENNGDDPRCLFSFGETEQENEDNFCDIGKNTLYRTL